jgi:hypothetical protein
MLYRFPAITIHSRDVHHRHLFLTNFAKQGSLLLDFVSFYPFPFSLPAPAISALFNPAARTARVVE